MADDFPVPGPPEIPAQKRPNIWLVLSLVAFFFICSCFVIFFVLPIILAVTGQ